MTIKTLNIPRGFSPFFFMETPVTQYMKVEEQVWDSMLKNSQIQTFLSWRVMIV